MSCIDFIKQLEHDKDVEEQGPVQAALMRFMSDGGLNRQSFGYEQNPAQNEDLIDRMPYYIADHNFTASAMATKKRLDENVF